MKTGINLCHSIRQWFLRFDIKSISNKEKTDKIQNICASKYISKKMKYSTQKEKILENHVSDKELIPQMYKEHKQ